MIPGITVAIAAHPERVRNGMLNRAITSVYGQTRGASALSVVVDKERYGAALTRQRALMMVRTEWVAFLDSDDEFLPPHLDTLANAAEQYKLDYVFSYFVRSQGGDPLQHFGRIWNPELPHQTTITTLVRTELAQSVGFCDESESNEINGQRWGEDYSFTVGCNAAGAKIMHVPKETWIWHRHGKNSSGQPGRGDA